MSSGYLHVQYNHQNRWWSHIARWLSPLRDPIARRICLVDSKVMMDNRWEKAWVDAESDQLELTHSGGLMDIITYTMSTEWNGHRYWVTQSFEPIDLDSDFGFFMNQLVAEVDALLDGKRSPLMLGRRGRIKVDNG